MFRVLCTRKEAPGLRIPLGLEVCTERELGGGGVGEQGELGAYELENYLTLSY